MRKIKKGDLVIATAGKDKGRTGTVLKVLKRTAVKNPDKGDLKVWVEGLNQVTKHIKANPQQNEPGSIKKVEAPIHISNVSIFNSATNKADKVKFKLLEDGKTTVRIFKSTGELVDI